VSLGIPEEADAVWLKMEGDSWRRALFSQALIAALQAMTFVSNTRLQIAASKQEACCHAVPFSQSLIAERWMKAFGSKTTQH